MKQVVKDIIKRLIKSEIHQEESRIDILSMNKIYLSQMDSTHERIEMLDKMIKIRLGNINELRKALKGLK